MAELQQLIESRDRALSAVCRGSTLLVADAAGLLELERCAAASCRTIVLLEVLPADQSEAVALLEFAWARVKPGGRLVVVVPHRLAVDAADARKRRELQRLLEGLGRPKLSTEQPYRWLIMHVKKPKPDEPLVPVAVERRYQVIAGLCRGRVLEVGCGPGHLAAAVAERGLPVVGVDINTPKIQAAARRYPHITFVQGDAATVDVGTRAFHTAVIAEVLEHVDVDTGNRILERATRALDAGGRLIVSVPNEKCIPHPNHIRTFAPHSLRALLRPFGKPEMVTDQPYKWLLMYVDLNH